jgi:hypothetical protein
MKSDPALIAALALDGIAAGETEIIGDEITERVKQQLSAAPSAAWPPSIQNPGYGSSGAATAGATKASAMSADRPKTRRRARLYWANRRAAICSTALLLRVADPRGAAAAR